MNSASQPIALTPGQRHRASFSEQLRSKLIEPLARDAARLETKDLRRMMPNFTKASVSDLRNRRLHIFGLERLLFVADRFGYDVDIVVRKRAA